MPKELSIYEQLEFCTTRIEGKDGKGASWSGTGFFFYLDMGDNSNRIMPLIITNKHVVEGAAQLTIQFSKANAAGDPIYDTPYKIVMADMTSIVYHPNPDVDLCGIPFLDLARCVEAFQGKVFHKHFDNSQIPTQQQLEELDAVEDIMMIGYPNGLWDARHNNRLYLLGILYAGPQLTVTGDIEVVKIPDAQVNARSISHIPNNLGYIIRSERILELVEVIKKQGS